MVFSSSISCDLEEQMVVRNNINRKIMQAEEVENVVENKEEVSAQKKIY